MRRALLNLRRHWLLSAGCVAAIAAGLLVPLVLVIGAAGLGEVEARAVESLQAEVILAPGVGAEQARALSQEVAGWPDVASAQVLDGAANLALLRREVGGLDGLDASMVPTTINVRLRQPSEGMGRVAERLKALEVRAEVEGVEAGSVEVAQVVADIEPLRWVLVGLAALVALVGLLVVSNALGVGIFRRREEIEILRHIGGGDRHMIWPFYAESMWLGLFGGGVGAAALAAGLVALSRPLAEALPWAALDLGAVFLWAAPAAILSGVLLSWAGTALSLRVYLRQVEGVAW